MTMKRRTVLVAASGLPLIAGCTGSFGGGDERLDERGEIEVYIDGEPVDLSADRFQAEHAENHSMDFHLHDFDDYWYMEGHERVTFAEALDLLPHFAYENTDGHHVLAVDGTEYDERDGVEFGFYVNGEPVDPTTNELHDGDELRVEVDTDG